jgi:hypothetical protein
MRYLQTRSGLLRAGAIDLIGPKKTYRVCKLDGSHTPRHVHEISYHVGDQGFETEADAADVEEFLQHVLYK